MNSNLVIALEEVVKKDHICHPKSKFYSRAEKELSVAQYRKRAAFQCHFETQPNHYLILEVAMITLNFVQDVSSGWMNIFYYFALINQQCLDLKFVLKPFKKSLVNPTHLATG